MRCKKRWMKEGKDKGTPVCFCRQEFFMLGWNLLKDNVFIWWHYIKEEHLYMKKIAILLILVIISMCCSSAFADIEPMLFDKSERDTIRKVEGVFSIRGGVQFGMTVDEVKQIDKAVYIENTTHNSGYSYVMGYGGLDSLAGIPILIPPDSSSPGAGNMINYYFDDSGKLKEIGYDFGILGIESLNYYNELQANLMNKYGDFFSYPTNSYFPEPPEVTKITLRKFEETNNGNDFWVRHTGWILKYDDCYVVIESILNSDDNLRLGYKMITFDEMEAIVNDAESVVQNRYDEIEHDL